MKKHIGFKFPLEIEKSTGRIKTIEQGDAVRQSIKIITATNQGERLMRRGFGTDLNSYMFDSIDLSLITSMNDCVTRAIKQWEEHIEEFHVSIVPSFEIDAALQIDISYKTKFLAEVQSLHVINNLKP